jgi:23S rRNA G2069 N7-methylase RlmK/C1962 C5-methylase RlmI
VALAQKPATDKTGTKAPAAVLFTLKAITASGGRRVASINNRPFEAGEEGEIAFGASRVRVRCVEVREDSVIIDVDGQTQELRLRPKR